MTELLADLDRALALRRHLGVAGRTAARTVAAGSGWSVSDVLCTCGPADRPFEERHTGTGIAVVVAGTFGYRSAAGRALLTPGSLLLGDAGQPFECGHEHGEGDRCLAFQYDPDWFERLACDAGAPRGARKFRAPSLPPVRALAPYVARACVALDAPDDAGDVWEELAIGLAGRALEVAQGLAFTAGAPAVDAEARVAQVVRGIERDPSRGHSLAELAAEARVSRFHFLRSFERVTGVTPHQFVLRARLRAAALGLANGPAKVLDAAYDSGFGDLSNFNRTFRAEFGETPRAFRRRARRSRPAGSAQLREAGGTIPRNRA